MNQIEQRVLDILARADDSGYLVSRENKQLEYKENFSFGSKSKYFKTMVAFANNCGGVILFGVKDSPRIAVGLTNNKFDELSHDRFDEEFRGFFLPEVDWVSGIVNYDNKRFGYFYVYEAKDKPVICVKNEAMEKLTSGDIYYRYRGQSRKIEYAQLKYIIQEKIDSERASLMRHLKKITSVGAENIALVDLLSGSISLSKIDDKKLILDSALLSQLKEQVHFIEEGRFHETMGDPTLKIIGSIETASEILVPDITPDIDYPYIQKDIAQKLNITQYQTTALIWKLRLKGQKKYHLQITITSANNKKPSATSKYSDYAYMAILEYLNENKDKPNFLTLITDEFKARI